MAALARLVVILAAASTAPARPVQSQSGSTPPRGELIRAAMRVSHDTVGAELAVRIRYEVRAYAGAQSVPVAAVLFAGATIENASANDTPLQLTGGRRPAGTIPIQPSNTARILVIDVAYRVRLSQTIQVGDVSVPEQRVRLPVLAVLWPPTEALPGRFSADIALPPGVVARPAFPADMRFASVAGEQPRLSAFLPAVPAFVAFDVGQGEGPGFVFWGLFAAFLLIVLLYAVWMLRTERR